MPYEQDSFCGKLSSLRELLKETIAEADAALSVPQAAAGGDKSADDHAVLVTALKLVRLSCEGAEGAIQTHQERHGCREGHATRAEMKLFNVTTEHWEPVTTAVYGHPPYGALAYEASRKTGGDGKASSEGWIIDPRDLEIKRHTGTALFYTEAGLKLLREEGLEM